MQIFTSVEYAGPSYLNVQVHSMCRCEWMCAYAQCVQFNGTQSKLLSNCVNLCQQAIYRFQTSSRTSNIRWYRMWWSLEHTHTHNRMQNVMKGICKRNDAHTMLWHKQHEHSLYDYHHTKIFTTDQFYFNYCSI